MRKENGIIANALKIFLIMAVLCGFVYTMVITGISQVLFHDKANGSIIEVGGVKYGSELLAQYFNDESHMWGRIMNLNTGSYTDEEGHVLLYASASNKSPAGEELEAAVQERIAMIREADPDANQKAIPVELVTNSGSGLDPHISPAAAEYQVPRIAAANHMTEDEVREIIDRYTTGRFLGILGEETVNVLEVNLALEGILTE